MTWRATSARPHLLAALAAALAAAASLAEGAAHSRRCRRRAPGHLGRLATLPGVYLVAISARPFLPARLLSAAAGSLRTLLALLITAPLPALIVRIAPAPDVVLIIAAQVELESKVSKRFIISQFQEH
jgi:hypothetical protein